MGVSEEKGSRVAWEEQAHAGVLVSSSAGSSTLPLQETWLHNNREWTLLVHIMN